MKLTLPADPMKIRGIREQILELMTVPNIAAFCFLSVTLLTSGTYGFFCDELYYFACARHLAWGYVDHPPMVALIIRISTGLFGENMFSLRLMSGLAGAGTVLLAARLAKLLGGGRYSQSLAALSICFSVAFSALSSFFSMNPVDIFLCTLFIFVFLKTLEKPAPYKWILLGVLLGIGLLNKYTFLVLGFSLFVSLIITKRWSLFRTPWIYISGIIGLLMFTPHILWQVNHGWPTLEFMNNASNYKNMSLSPLGFFTQLIFGLNPFTLPVWLSGWIVLMFGKGMKKFRFLGITAIIFILAYLVQNSKFYYVVPIFPLLFSSGSVAVEQWVEKLRVKWLKLILVSLVVISGIVLLPLAVPMLPVNQFVGYAKTLGIWDSLRMEQGEKDVLPLHFVHRFGWKEMVEKLAEAYRALPENERNQCALLAGDYGMAGAIDLYGPMMGLPKAICPHNNYWLWGPGNYSGEVVLAIRVNESDLREYFEHVERVTGFDQPYAYGADIYLCKNPKVTLEEMWLKLKKFI